jgi:hypothetical protein
MLGEQTADESMEGKKVSMNIGEETADEGMEGTVER